MPALPPVIIDQPVISIAERISLSEPIENTGNPVVQDLPVPLLGRVNIVAHINSQFGTNAIDLCAGHLQPLFGRLGIRDISFVVSLQLQRKRRALPNMPELQLLDRIGFPLVQELHKGAPILPRNPRALRLQSISKTRDALVEQISGARVSAAPTPR